MARQWILVGVLWAIIGVAAAGAEESPEMQPHQDTAQMSFLDTARTIAYLPFKGVVCVVGVVASFPAYWLSGMDPEVKSDTEMMRAKYCSREYLLGAEWQR